MTFWCISWMHCCAFLMCHFRWPKNGWDRLHVKLVKSLFRVNIQVWAQLCRIWEVPFLITEPLPSIHIILLVIKICWDHILSMRKLLETSVVCLFHGTQKGGFFIECGSTNGERASNTIYMERKMGWTGLLIEVDPYFFLQLIGRNCNSLNACLSTQRKIGTVREYTHSPDRFKQRRFRQHTCIFGATH